LEEKAYDEEEKFESAKAKKDKVSKEYDIEKIKKLKEKLNKNKELIIDSDNDSLDNL
jgi:hypothetical protein